MKAGRDEIGPFVACTRKKNKKASRARGVALIICAIGKALVITAAARSGKPIGIGMATSERVKNTVRGSGKTSSSCIYV